MNFYDRKISCFLNVWNISESEIFLHSFFSCKDFKLTILIRFCFQLIIAIPFHIKKKKQAKLRFVKWSFTDENEENRISSN